MTSDDILDRQLAFYRSDAAAYEAWHTEVFERGGGGSFGEACRRDRQRALTDLEALGPLGRVLELACGTGSYTPFLLARATRVTAVDASPESLDIARSKLAGSAERLAWIEADLFHWTPSRRWDTVFFAYWLSHVPSTRFGTFWSLVEEALVPNGRVFLIDSTGSPIPLEYSDGTSTYRADDDRGAELSRRELDGRTYHVVKVVRGRAELAARLADLGWRASLAEGAHALWGTVVRRRAGGSRE
jgi:demethylmenaquinone methyltransferase/2-methoxy-6-polyprenyl-1,4-benzoquinol methylase